MICFKPIKRSLRGGILSTFSALLFLSFASVGAAFNIAVDQYIRSSALTQLSNSRISIALWAEQNHPQFNSAAEAHISDALANMPQSYAFRLPLSALIANDAYEVQSTRLVPAEAEAILDTLKAENAVLDTNLNRRIRTLNGEYYVVGSDIDIVYNNQPSHMIFYADVTLITRFASTINLLLIMLVTGIWLMSMLLITYLSNSISKPIRTLSLFATRIGHGDFTPNTFVFPEIELNNLNQSLNQAAKQLAVYDSEQKTFFQNVSHELRTPLMSIKCYAEGIQYGLMEPGRASETILDETDRLAGMVDDLLYISKIDNISATASMETINLCEMLQACAAQHEALAQSNNLIFVFNMDDQPVMYHCARKHLTRAVNNLISNAIRYAESAVTLVCQRQKTHICLRVADDGPGIAPEVMPHVFERFYKGDTGNHGIGLSIVKTVAEQHKGTASAFNADKGAVFTITLPV